MQPCDYLIIGGGIAADAAVRGIRESDGEGTIRLLCAEPHPPYDRPPLSKKLWQGKPLSAIWRNTADAGAELLLERRATAVDAVRKIVIDERGEQHGYRKLLLATGGTPRRLPFPAEGVIYFRTVADYEQLRRVTDAGGEVVVIGAGFIGSEVAASLAANGVRVTLVFPGAAIGARAYPTRLAEFLNNYFLARGVELLPRETVSAVERSGGRFKVITGSGRELGADAVVAGLGITPDTALARAAGLDTDNGIVVDEQLRAGNPDIYAAGDVAQFYNPALDRRLRIEHEDNARTMGAVAGRNMAGGSERYHHLPFFYSDLFDLGYEAVGEIDAAHETVELWQEPFRKGVIYYLNDGRVRGVLLWNVWDKVDAARVIIASKQRHDAQSLHGLIA